MDNKLNPLQMVSRELSEQTDDTAEDIEQGLMGLLMHLQARAMKEIDKDPESEAAQDAAFQYKIACEAIAMFGTSLIAFEDIEEEEFGHGDN